MKAEQLIKLREPFAPEDIEWRLQSCGEKNGKFWGMCLAYITSRAVQDRLDEVCGTDGWQVAVRREGEAYLATLSIRVEHDDGTVEWISRTDGADSTDIEAVKGGISGAIKRCAVLFGVGRYLYNLKDNWAETSSNERASKEYPLSGKTKDGKWFTWRPPKLPSWALPSEKESKKEEVKADNTGLSPEADRLRKQEIRDSEEYKTLKESFDKYIASGTLSQKSIDKINKALEDCDINYLKEVAKWCENQLKKAG